MSFPETVVTPPEPISHLARMVALIERAEPKIARRLLRLVRDSGELASLEEIAALLSRGQIDEALRITDDIAPGIYAQLDQLYTAAGLSSAEVLRSEVDTLFDFNRANQRASDNLAVTRLRLVREFSREQRLATIRFLEDAFQRGLPPIEQARALKHSIGLTEYQARIIGNYRTNLESRSAAALGRELRDRRFDSTVARSIRTGQPLTPAQIDTMVGRYRERWLQYRAKTIAKTESTRAAHAGDEEAFSQAIDGGVMPASAIVNTWRAALRNTRDSHLSPLNGQVQPFGVPFRSGNGYLLRYPGDPSAPGSETINCQCVLVRNVDREVMQAFRPPPRRAA